MRQLAAFSVIYPGSLPYLPDFWHSIQPELTSYVDLHLSLDSVAEDEVLTVVGAGRQVHVVTAPTNTTPAEIRAAALKEIATSYRGVVLLDSDDIVLPGRIAAAEAGLQTHDVYGCSLHVVDEAGKALGGPAFGPDPGQIAELERGAPLLASRNAYGFSNSAYRSSILLECLDIHPDTVLMDWLVASRAFLGGASFTFDPEPRMLYRQYGSNIVDLTSPLSPRRIVQDTRRVANHYELLLDRPHGCARDVAPFAEARQRTDAFLEWLGPDPGSETKAAMLLTEPEASHSRIDLWWDHIASAAERFASHDTRSNIRQELDRRKT